MSELLVLGRICVVPRFVVSGGCRGKEPRSRALAARRRRVIAMFAGVLALSGSVAVEAQADGISTVGVAPQAAASTASSSVAEAVAQPTPSSAQPTATPTATPPAPPAAPSTPSSGTAAAQTPPAAVASASQ